MHTVHAVDGHGTVETPRLTKLLPAYDTYWECKLYSRIQKSQTPHILNPTPSATKALLHGTTERYDIYLDVIKDSDLSAAAEKVVPVLLLCVCT